MLLSPSIGPRATKFATSLFFNTDFVVILAVYLAEDVSVAAAFANTATAAIAAVLSTIAAATSTAVTVLSPPLLLLLAAVTLADFIAVVGGCPRRHRRRRVFSVSEQILPIASPR